MIRSALIIAAALASFPVAKLRAAWLRIMAATVTGRDDLCPPHRPMGSFVTVGTAAGRSVAASTTAVRSSGSRDRCVAQRRPALGMIGPGVVRVSIE